MWLAGPLISTAFANFVARLSASSGVMVMCGESLGKFGNPPGNLGRARRVCEQHWPSMTNIVRCRPSSPACLQASVCGPTHSAGLVPERSLISVAHFLAMYGLLRVTVQPFRLDHRSDPVLLACRTRAMRRSCPGGFAKFKASSAERGSIFTNVGQSWQIVARLGPNS